MGSFAEKIDYGLKRIKRMMEKDVLPPDGGEDVIIVSILKRGRERRDKWRILQIRPVDP